MKKLFTILIVCLLPVIMLAQVFEWEYQNPKPHANNLRAVKVFDANTIIAFGEAGVMQRSVDGGTTWTVSYPDAAGRDFRSAKFVNSSVGYACGSGGLLMKTTDGGVSILPLTSPTTELLYDIDFYDADNGFAVGANGTVLKTTDGGASWSKITMSISNALYAVCAQAADNIFIGAASVSGTSQRVIRSTDNGANWIDVTPPGLTQTVWDIFFISSTKGWVSTQNSGNVYYTTDAGATWSNSTIGLFVPNTVKFQDELTGFVTTNSNGNVYKTTDAGTTWTPYASGTQYLYNIDILESVIFSVGRYGSTFKSTDGGATYNACYEAVTHTALRDIEFLNSSTGLAAGGSSTASDALGFLLKTTDAGNTWSPIGDFGFQVYSLSIASPNVWYIGRGRNAIYKTTDGGVTFEQQTHPMTSATAHYNDIGAANENTAYAFHSSGGIVKTTDGGTNWVSANSPFGTTNVYSGYVIDENTVVAAGGSAKAFKTTDGGATWTALETGIPGNFFVVRFLNANFGIIAGFNSPNPVASKTTDGGATWTPIEFPSEYDGNSIWSIGYRNENMFWMGDVNGNVYYTNNGGTIWSAAKKVASNSIFSICVVGDDMWLSGNGGTILKGFSDSNIPVELTSFTASVSGKSVSLSWKTATELNNNGFNVERRFADENWQKVAFIKGHGTTSEVSEYSFNDKPGKTGIIQYRLKQMDLDGTYEYSKVVEVDLTLPDKYELSQNYPNPFNPSTSIKYSLAANSKVELKIYNILGREVAQLVNEVQDAGTYEVNFNASLLTSGVYIYELNTGSFKSQRKMILIK